MNLNWISSLQTKHSDDLNFLIIHDSHYPEESFEIPKLIFTLQLGGILFMLPHLT